MPSARPEPILPASARPQPGNPAHDPLPNGRTDPLRDRKRSEPVEEPVTDARPALDERTSEPVVDAVAPQLICRIHDERPDDDRCARTEKWRGGLGCATTWRAGSARV